MSKSSPTIKAAKEHKENKTSFAEIEAFTPTKDQLDALSRRLMPEIKKFFADEQTQKEFISWKEKQK
jgi:hypothetical protein